MLKYGGPRSDLGRLTTVSVRLKIMNLARKIYVDFYNVIGNENEEKDTLARVVEDALIRYYKDLYGEFPDLGVNYYWKDPKTGELTEVKTKSNNPQ